jgi:hypothetical protein
MDRQKFISDLVSFAGETELGRELTVLESVQVQTRATQLNRIIPADYPLASVPGLLAQIAEEAQGFSEMVYAGSESDLADPNSDYLNPYSDNPPDPSQTIQHYINIQANPETSVSLDDFLESGLNTDWFQSDNYDINFTDRLGQKADALIKTISQG